jgi:hypothetical protein
MFVQLMACEILIDRVLDLTFIEIAIRGVDIAHRHRAGARTLTELLGMRGFDDTELADPVSIGRRRVNVRVDLWIVELIEELAESRKASHVGAFIRDAVLAYVDGIAADAASEPAIGATRTAS